jgi:cytochrome c oxidase subunit 1
MTGRLLNEKVARVAWVLVFLGFNVTFFTMFIVGVRGMPRRYAEYLPKFHTENVVSTIGSAILAAGILVMVWNFVQGLRNGAKAGANPWRSLTLEWRAASPPETENFHEIPQVDDWPYGYGTRGPGKEGR